MQSANTISAEQLRGLVEASRRARKVRRCAGVAMFGGWTTGVFGGVSLMGLPFSFSAAGLFVSAGLLIAAYGEFHGAKLVRGFDVRGPKRLALNQMFLGAVLVIYAIWSLVQGLSAEGLPPSMASGDPQVDAMVAGLTRTVNLGVFGTLALVGVVAPGLTAWYYASREKYVREFRQQTDASVVEALKAA